MSPRPSRPLALYSIAAAIAAVLLSPLLALSYFETSEGAEGLEVGTIAAWAEPGRDLAGSLLTFASPDRVYSTYSLVFALLVPAVILSAFAALSERPSSQTRSERWGWRLVRIGYLVFGVGLGLVAIALIWAGPSAPVVNVGFMTLLFPGLVVGLIGSTFLGASLVRSGYEPRLTAWLLALALPLWIVGSVVLGHNGFGLLPLFVAWAATARRWSQSEIGVQRASSASDSLRTSA